MCKAWRERVVLCASSAGLLATDIRLSKHRRVIYDLVSNDCIVLSYVFTGNWHTAKAYRSFLARSTGLLATSISGSRLIGGVVFRMSNTQEPSFHPPFTYPHTTLVIKATTQQS
jgi:hypothetical protein